jgi:hypothetical protein
LNPVPLQERRPRHIAAGLLRCGVLPAVQLDRKPRRFAAAVQYVWADRVLASELHAGQLAIAQQVP